VMTHSVMLMRQLPAFSWDLGKIAERYSYVSAE